ncbi:MAG: Ni/Fe hydrogenase subunit alpha [Deltaproteobacteria bacterium]|nr:Ni/Fe hydrogenase subunit alpha [Deltaproteobacteria bacterium]
MGRKITIDPITRIEGHARVEIDVDDNNKVTSSVFQVLDFRGWETFLRGMQVENMATITPRICGTCPQTHHLASARTLDRVFDVQIPRPAELLRYAANMGGLVHSHAVHFFALAAPDLVMGVDAKPETRNIVGLVQAMPDLATKALRLRSVGHKIVELIGGRGTHPVSCVAGGLSTPLGKDKRDVFSRLANEGLTLSRELFDVGKKALFADRALAESLPIETHYMGTSKDGALDLYQGALRFVSADGDAFEFSEDRYTDHIVEFVGASTYAKHTRFRKDPNGDSVPYRVGPLARLNTCDFIDTPLAQKEFEEFRVVAGFPSHETMFYHYARLIELLHAVEKLAELAKDDEIYSDNVRTKKLNAPRSATAHVEAPRGTLIHDYDVDENGIVKKANLLVATQQNIPAINETISMSAEKFINQSDGFLLNAIEMGIRCYDPCLSCATHRYGEMKLDVIVRKEGHELRRARR